MTTTTCHDEPGDEEHHDEPGDDEERHDEAPTRQLADIDLTPAAHVQVHLHAAILALVDHVRLLEPDGDLRTVLDRFGFLSGYLDEIVAFLPADITWPDALAWWEASIEQWERPGRDDLVLCRLRDALGLDRSALLGLLLAGLVEEDSRFGAVFAHLSGGFARRPTFEVLVSIGRRTDVTPIHRSVLGLVDLGLVEVEDRSGPRSEWVLAASRAIWDLIVATEPSARDHRPLGDLPRLDDLVLDEAAHDRCRRIVERWADLDLITVRGSVGSDRLDIVAAMAGAAGHGVLHVDAAGCTGPGWHRIGAVVAALDAVAVVELDIAPGETVNLARPPGLRGPIAVVLGATGGIERRGHERAVAIDVPVLDAAGRARRWRVALGGSPVEDLDAIAEACRLQGAHIDRVARSATALAAVEGARAVRLDHVRSAADDLQRQLLDSLATKLDVAGCWDDVVVGDFTALKLDELEARCRHRDALGASLAAAYGVGTGIGVRALFTGASGTGKTLAARVLGSRLGLDVYRVDLAAIINKYVGETEKNLHRILTTAEELDVVLLIDEGDSLLGRRTDVRSANDRFANLETNYLLQRLEHYRGIVVITTNAADQVDPAFQRRMDVVVSFVAPTPRERAEIWRLHLPGDHRVPEALVVELAQRCTMTGGQIRNAVLHAVLLALDEGLPVGAGHIEHAVASEYQKAGAVSPYDPNGRSESVSRSRSFHQVIA